MGRVRGRVVIWGERGEERDVFWVGKGLIWFMEFKEMSIVGIYERKEKGWRGGVEVGRG